MRYNQFIELASYLQASVGLAEIRAILDCVDPGPILDKLNSYRLLGRKGYSQRSLWRAHFASFLLNLDSTNHLIRRLQDDPELRLLCGFGQQLPHRTTFNRFIIRLGHHHDLVDHCFAQVTDRLAELLPGFGYEAVAVDSTTVRTHANPNRQPVSDQGGTWTAKNAAGAKNGAKEWHFGYKYHLVVDAQYGLPITGYTTTASRNDSPELPVLLEKGSTTHGWFRPKYVIADRGYDSRANHEAVLERGVVPIIGLRNTSKQRNKLLEGIYTVDGRPTCLGLKPMEYVRSDPQKGRLYRCPKEGCHLKTRGGVRYCDEEVWENRQDNPRLFGRVPRDSSQWKTLYRLRQSVERVFKSLKQSRRLERHCIRGLRKIALHAALSVLACSATALVKVLTGQFDDVRWMVRRVA